MPSLKLKPVQGSVGADVMAIGAGFRPNVSYRIQFEDRWLRPGTMTNRGTFVAHFKAPVVPFGEQDITLVSQAAQQLAHATFRVVPQIAEVEPAVIILEDRLTVVGTGFGRGEPIAVSIDQRVVELDPAARADANGVVTVRFIVTEELVPPTPVMIAITGKETGARAQTKQNIEVKLAS